MLLGVATAAFLTGCSGERALGPTGTTPPAPDLSAQAIPLTIDTRTGHITVASPAGPSARSGAAGVGPSMSLIGREVIGGLVGTTLGVRLGGMLSFHVAADDYIYGTRIDQITLAADKKTQNDVQLALGFGFPVGR